MVYAIYMATRPRARAYKTLGLMLYLLHTTRRQFDQNQIAYTLREYI